MNPINHGSVYLYHSPMVASNRKSSHPLGCPGTEVIGSMAIGSMGYFTDPYKWGIPWGEKKNTDPITIDPITSGSRDIQAAPRR